MFLSISDICLIGAHVVWFVEALRYKLKGHGFDSHDFSGGLFFQLHYSPGVKTASNRSEWRKGQAERKTRNFHHHVWADCLEIVGTSLTVSQPFGPTWPVTGIALPRLSLILHYPLLNLLMQYEYTSIFHVWQDNTTINQYNHTFLLISRISSLLWVCYMHTYYNII